MSTLETISDLVAIIRDLLIVTVIFVLIFSAISIMSFISKIGPAMSSGGSSLGLIAPLVGGNLSGNLPGMQGGKYPLDTVTIQQVNELGSAFESGDTASILQKLDKLEQHFSSKGWNDAAQLVKELKQAYASGDMKTFELKAAQLISLFQGGEQAVTTEAAKYGYKYMPEHMPD